MLDYSQRIWLIVFLVALILPSMAATRDSARVIILKAIKAQGGTEKIARLRIMRIKAEGTMTVSPDQANCPVIFEDIWQMPTRYRSTLTMQLIDGTITQTQVIDGDTGWIQVNNQPAQRMSREALAEMKEQKYAEDLDRLLFLNDKTITLSILEEIMINEKPATGVLVKSKGHREVSLYFETGSGLLVKRIQHVKDDERGKEVMQEVTFSDYREKDGVNYYRHITMSREGVIVVDAKLTEVKVLSKVDDKLFALP